MRGLSDTEVAERIASGRANIVERTTSRSPWDIIRSNVFTRINAIYAILFGIVAFTGHLIDGLFGALILVNSSVGMIQEFRAKRTLDRLAIIGRVDPTVLREGERRSVPAAELVCDDVVILASGDTIIVDGPVLAAVGLEVDESMLTGESDPVLKDPGDRVLSGSYVVAGSGSFRADRVGADAFAQRLAAEARGFRPVRSELRAGIDRILKVITYVLIPVGILTIFNQLFRNNQPLDEALRGMVAALVPMVPEGLVLMTSVALAVGVIRLGKRNCLVQDLPAIEELARVDVVCTDKTGTLTENGMTLDEVRPLAEDGEIEDALRALGGAEERPNASIAAIIAGLPGDSAWERVGSVPFSSARKWSAGEFRDRGAWILGAPDVLLPEADPARAESEALAARGLRVLLLGRIGELPPAEEIPGTVTPAALVVLGQRVRPEARGALDYFAEQDVAVKVISGDNAASVGAVAATLGIPAAETPVDARTLPEPGEEFSDRIAAGTVFGRVNPEQKRDMVRALRAEGHGVAMTGDGVNDVLALKEANVGVAMGSGSPASRAVSRIVLLDDSFATLPHVVAEGRRVIGNIERVSTLFLTKTVYSILLAMITVIAAVPFPFLPRHITIIAWFTIGIPAFLLSLAPNTERARPGFVGRVLRIAIPAGAWIAAATMTTFLVTFDRHAALGEAQVQASTSALITVLAVALWVLAAVARPYVPWKVLLVAAMAGAVTLLLVTPWGGKIFQLDPGNLAFTGFALVSAGIAILGILGTWRLMAWRSRRARARAGA